MSLSVHRRIIVAKAESPAGTPASISSSDVLFYAYDGTIQNNVEFTARTAAGTLSQLPAQPGIEPGEHRFTVELVKAAAWAPILMPALGFVDDDGDLSGTSWQPTDDHTKWLWLTSGQNLAGKFKKISGALASAVFNLNAGQVPTVDFTLTGRYEAEADVAQYTPQYSIANQHAGAKLGSATATLGGTAICFASATLSINNTVSLLLCASASGGIQHAWIESREIQLVIDPLEVLAATRNDDAIQRAKTLQAFALSWGDMSISMPKCQLRQIVPGERNGLSARQLTFVGTINSAYGDELVIDFDTTTSPE